MKEQDLFNFIKIYWEDLVPSEDEMSRYDCYSKGSRTRIELKCRRKHYEALMLEKSKYDYLTDRHRNNNEIPLYINSTPKGIYCFDLRTVSPQWITDEKMPRQTDFKDTAKTKKTYCLLPVSQAIKVKDMNKEVKAINKFVNRFKGSYKKLDPTDIDYRISDKDNNVIAYAEVAVVTKYIANCYPLPIHSAKVVKLCAKRLNPVLIWALEDGIIYAKVPEIIGETKWERGELMLYYPKQKTFKYAKYY